jgi:glycosyltransferase involved in cell wall biosynthesis
MDTRMLATPGGTGVSSYARALHHAHAALGEDHVLLSDRPYLDRPAPAPLGRAGRWLRALMPGGRRAREADGPDGERLFVAPDLFRMAQVYFDVHRRPLPVHVPGPAGIMHWTYPVPLHVTGWRNLYTVHDVIPLLHPALTHIDGRRYRRLLDRLSASAARFITVSESARGEIVEAIGCSPDFVIDCGLTVDGSPADAQALPGGLVPGRYLLVCGTVEPRKNLVRLAEAYRRSGVTLPLVVAGPDGWAAAELDALLAATPGAIRLPYLDRSAVHALLGHARALLMPSLAEGFGLPVAEAMALGTPVLTSNRGALAETAGGAALTASPEDLAALVQAITRLATDDALCTGLAEAGRRNADRFSAARFRERLTAAYVKVMTPSP